ncbi:hypothetical protein MOMUL_02970 [Moorella mulderi DSM 14980]|uniref:PIN domain-containing protein n=1 Tax=Moorella mulderi DSM 14980 TaxID=1122241 RepID=A0A151B108_9FIRM|nr:hypothetical protein MOMUL_02970 [Moorella mulderi DSM 14980]
MALVLVDSSAVLALLNRHDQWHNKAKIVLQDLVNQQASFIMTNYFRLFIYYNPCKLFCHQKLCGGR